MHPRSGMITLNLAGSPWEFPDRATPQIGTCPIQAFGSSSWRFAMMHPAHHRQCRYPWSLRGLGFGTLSSRQVSRPRFPNSASPSLHQVPVTRVPRLRRYYERLRTRFRSLAKKYQERLVPLRVRKEVSENAPYIFITQASPGASFISLRFTHSLFVSRCKCAMK